MALDPPVDAASPDSAAQRASPRAAERRACAGQDAVRAFEDLRLAEARLERRRPPELHPRDRIGLHYVVERAAAGEPARPSDLAAHLGISQPSITAMLARLAARGAVTTRAHESDRRGKVIAPAAAIDGVEPEDESAERILQVASRRSDAEMLVVRGFLDDLRELIDRA